MIGTAFPAARVLMVEQPGPWGRAGLRQSRFDPAAAAELEARARAAGTRVLAVRRPGANRPAGTRRWLFADTTPGARVLRTGEFADASELLDQFAGASSGTVGEPVTEPLFLVCTHARHDTCCAVAGRPLAAVLQELRPGQVWESTHLGGDRFAPNLLVLPNGMLYGRVDLATVGDIVEAAERGGAVVEHLRGRVGLTPAAQAGFALLLRHLPDIDPDGVLPVGTSPLGDGRTTVRFAVGNLEADVCVAAERVAAQDLTCANLGPGTFVTHRAVAWQFRRTA
jgi:hypothetical protein